MPEPTNFYFFAVFLTVCTLAALALSIYCIIISPTNGVDGVDGLNGIDTHTTPYSVITSQRTQQTILNSNSTAVIFDTDISQQNWPDREDLTTFIAPIDGVYGFNYHIYFPASGSHTGRRATWISKNTDLNDRQGYDEFTTTSSSTPITMNGSGYYQLSAGEYLQVWVDQSTGVSQNISETNVDLIYTASRAAMVWLRP